MGTLSQATCVTRAARYRGTQSNGPFLHSLCAAQFASVKKLQVAKIVERE